MRKLLTLGLMTTAILAAGCGGGGSSSSSGGGGGGGGGQTGTIATPGPPNVESLILDGGPASLPVPSINTAFITVQVCVPNTTTCQTIDHIEIDTGSIGLRILADATDTSGATFSVALPAETSSGELLAECLQFADGSSWGAVKTADITLPVSGEHASSVNVQIIGDASAGGTTPPNGLCEPAPPLGTENTVATFGANGILGVGPFINDCNDVGGCTPGASATYYTCSSASSCNNPYTASLTQQVPNPVSLFAKDNNGVIIELPAVADAGAASIGDGALVFGIGTENNNSLGSATELTADPDTGFIAAELSDGTQYPDSYLDSGSNANFFATSLTACPSPNSAFYCPSSTVSETATLTGANGMTSSAPFDVANADDLFTANPTFTAFPSLAGTNALSSSLDLGLPFFFGRNVYTGIYIPGTTPAPYFAYISN